MALPAALLVPTVVACVIFIAYLIQTVLGLQALRVALQRSKSAQMAFRRVPWNAGTPFLQSALRSYGLLTAGTPWVAFAAAAGWALLLLPGLAFIHWEPAAFWAPAPWLSPTSALGRAEALRSASFPAPLDALELLVAPTDTSVSVLSFQHLDGLVNLHNAVTGAELSRKTGWLRLRPAGSLQASCSARACPILPQGLNIIGQSAAWAARARHNIGLVFTTGTEVYYRGRRYTYEDVCERRVLGTRASCEFDSVLRLLYPSLPPRPLKKTDLLASIDRARLARLNRERSGSAAAAAAATAAASAAAAAVGDDAVQHMYEQMGRTLLAPKGQSAYDHLESEAVTGVPQRSAQVPRRGVATGRSPAAG